MKIFRLKNGFERLGDAALALKAGTIISRLTGNPHFPAPSPSLATVSATADGFSATLIDAARGHLQQIALKNRLREDLVLQLHLLSQYVLFQSAGNEVAAVSSGFTVSPERQSRPALAAPTDVVMANGVNRGELLLKCRRVANVQSYRHEITPYPATTESRWQSVQSTVSKNLFGGLQSGTEYCCRIMAIGPKKQAVYSEVVSRVAL